MRRDSAEISRRRAICRIATRDAALRGKIAYGFSRSDSLNIANLAWHGCDIVLW
jgi:hypothetical protein